MLRQFCILFPWGKYVITNTYAHIKSSRIHEAKNDRIEGKSGQFNSNNWKLHNPNFGNRQLGKWSTESRQIEQHYKETGSNSQKILAENIYLWGNKLTPVLTNSSKKIKEKGTLSHPFYEVSIILTAKIEKHMTRKVNYRPISLINVKQYLWTKHQKQNPATYEMDNIP